MSELFTRLGEVLNGCEGAKSPVLTVGYRGKRFIRIGCAGLPEYVDPGMTLSGLPDDWSPFDRLYLRLDQRIGDKTLKKLAEDGDTAELVLNAPGGLLTAMFVCFYDVAGSHYYGPNKVLEGDLVLPELCVRGVRLLSYPRTQFYGMASVYQELLIESDSDWTDSVPST